MESEKKENLGIEDIDKLIPEGMNKEEVIKQAKNYAAIVEAIDHCVENGIMADYLSENREKVIEILMYELAMRDMENEEFDDEE